MRAGSGTHEFLNWLTAHGRCLSHPVGMVTTHAVHQAVLKVPVSAWTPAVDPDAEIRDGACAAELAGDCLQDWLRNIRLIVRKERPYPGTHLRITDAEGMRITRFATETADRPIEERELRHRRRARAENRTRVTWPPETCCWR